MLFAFHSFVFMRMVPQTDTDLKDASRQRAQADWGAADPPRQRWRAA